MTCPQLLCVAHSLSEQEREGEAQRHLDDMQQQVGREKDALLPETEGELQSHCAIGGGDDGSHMMSTADAASRDAAGRRVGSRPCEGTQEGHQDDGGSSQEAHGEAAAGATGANSQQTWKRQRR